MPTTLIVFSHLRWSFVYQRPQQLMTRLARHYRILFFEEPLPDGRAFLEITEPARNVRVCRPHTGIASPGFHDAQLPVLHRLLEELLRRERIVDYAVWLYTPMALPLTQRLAPRAIVYDCMDELSAFLNAPRQLLQRENALLKSASLVFTGGPSLYRAKRARHPAVYCFPSSVEAGHFAQARDASIDHPEQRALARPRLGFYGVIDERLDLGLIERLADARPHWQLAMVGPVVKIDPAALPRRSNIHYFGQRDYAELPHFLAGWDACLLPFALNEATRFISPTKTLEYMAAQKPIVSTPIADVAEPYGHIVHLASGAAGFVAACEAALTASPDERRRRTEQMRRTVEGTSWDGTAEQMHQLIAQVSAAKLTAVARELLHLDGEGREVQAAAAQPLSGRGGAASAAASRVPIVIVGGGPTGLSAAYHAGEDSLLLEQHDTVGGWCRSIVDRGFTFDYAGHIMFSNDPYVHQLYRMLLGENVHWQDREAWIYSKGVYTRYPFQGALYGLPPDVLKECIVGAIEARFGRLKPEGGAKAAAGAAAKGAPAAGSSASECKTEALVDCCADGIAESAVPLGSAPQGDGKSADEPRNFEEFIYKVWGAGVARHFAIPYNRKLWAVPLDEMETSWLGGRVPLPDLEEMIEGALRPLPKPMGPNARFGYPLRGGFQALVDGFLPRLRGELQLEARVVRVVPAEREVVLADGSAVGYEQLISTMPLPKLIEMIGAEAPEYVRQAAKELRHVSVRCVNLGIGREHLTEKHWIYYPEDTVFHRIFVQGNASPHCNPPGGFGLTCEITYSPYKPLPCDGEALVDLCVRDCIRVGLIRADDPILARNQVDMPYAYVVYDHARQRNVELIRSWLASQDILLAGRYSEWAYYNSDHAFLAGKKAAEAALAALQARSAGAADARQAGGRSARSTTLSS